MVRGQQSGYGIDRVDIDAPANLQVQYVSVLALLSCYVALVLMSVFIMDWFVVRYPSNFGGWGGARESVDLWAVSTCDPSFGCVSTPLERGGFSAFRPFAVTTLWLTALSAAALLLRTGAFLLGVRVSRRVSTIASVLLGVSALAVLAMVFSIPPPSPHGASVHPSAAPFLLVTAHVIGLLSIGLALREPRTHVVGRAGVPSARLLKS